MLRVKIAGVGKRLPGRVVTNEEIARRLDSTPEWILTHTGVASRHVAGTDESAATLGAAAAREALAAAGVVPDEVGLVIVATSSSDYGAYPSTACLVQAELGCHDAAAFDLSAACSGFVYGLEMARCYLTCHPDRKALVVGTEVLSRQLDWSDRSNAMLFGDGAGAVVLATESADGDDGPSASLLGADGTGATMILREAGCRRPLCADPVGETVATQPVPYLRMDGHAVFSFAVRKLAEVVERLCGQVGTTPAALDLIIPHQANLRIIDAVARRMNLPPDRFFINLREVGNTSSASIPICLADAVRTGAVRNGMRVALAGFGSGLTWAGLLTRWPYL